MAYIIDTSSELLREPNLLLPGKKPIGPVTIDWTNPLTQGLQVAHSPDHKDYIHSELTDRPRIRQSFDVMAHGACPYGYGYKSVVGTSYVAMYYEKSFYNEITVYTRVYPTSYSESQAAFVDADGFTRLWQFRRENTSGNWTFLTITPAVTVLTSTNTVPVNTIQNIWGAITDIGNEIQVRLNGVKTTASYTDTLAEQDWVRTGDVRSTEQAGYMLAFYVWNRYLSDTEMAAIDADPYQILVPA